MLEVADAIYVEGYVLELKFENGRKGTYDLSN